MITKHHVAALVAAASLTFAFTANAQSPAESSHRGVPQDWSTNSIIYHNALNSSSNSYRWLRGADPYRDPRFVMAQARQLRSLQGNGGGAAPPTPAPTPSPAPSGTRLQLAANPGAQPDAIDWSASLGNGSGVQGVYPAKYSFDLSATPSCENDFVVYPTNAAGNANNPGTFSQWTGTISGSPGNGNTVTLAAGTPQQVVLTASLFDNTGSNFAYFLLNNSSIAANLRAAINRFTGTTGLSASGSGATVTITYPGVIGSNFVVESLSNFSLNYSTDASPGQATILAFNQLYQDGACEGAWNNNGDIRAPNVMWSYNTGTNNVVETSPVLSYLDDGKQVAFVQRNTSTNALSLVLLKWAAGQGTSAVAPVSPTLSVSASAYRSCTDNCYFVIPFSGTSNSGSDVHSYSSPFVDYFDDVLWVGDGAGNLHRFNGVFEGTPAEQVGSGFPAVVEAGAKLGSPGSYNGNVYLGSSALANNNGGRMNRVSTSNGSVAKSTRLSIADKATTGLRGSVIIDGGTDSVFGFLFNDGTAGDSTTCAEDPDTDGDKQSCRVVARFAAGFANGDAPVERAYVGRGNSEISTLYPGAFDNDYLNSEDGDGYMYIMGGNPNDTFLPTLWRIPLTDGAIGSSVRGPQIGSKTCSNNATCFNNRWDWSPTTIVKNGSNQFLFFSIGSSATFGSCTGACLYMIDIDSMGTWGPSVTADASFAVSGGTGGITVDNVSTGSGHSQIYFGTVNQLLDTTGQTGSAIQVSQADLD